MKVVVTYILEGSPSQLKINGKKLGELRPSPQLIKIPFEVVLNSGFNFLEFSKSDQDILKIFSLHIGEEAKRQGSQLHRGDKVTLLNRPGNGSISFRGRGRLKITQVSFADGEENIRVFNLKTPLWTKRIRRGFSQNTMNTLTAEVESGNFDIDEYAFVSATSRSGASNVVRPSRNPSIFIFLIDACQAKHLSLYGYGRSTSPHIDSFARDAVVFDNAYANASFTRSSVATLFTGLMPENHKVRILKNRLSPHLLTIPVYLKDKGYKTSFFISSGNISKSVGFARGVDDYFPFIGEWKRREEKAIPTQFCRWLSVKEPVFSYVHFMEPHLPLVPLSPFLNMFTDPKAIDFSRQVVDDFGVSLNSGKRFSPEEREAMVNNYDATIAYIDNELEKLLRCLREQGLYENSLIIIMSDHGESLYERGRWGHGDYVFEETSRVPLVVKFPAVMNLRGKVKSVVQLADVFPTIADLFGEVLKTDGKSLLPAISKNSLDDTLAVSRSFSVIGDFGIRWRNFYAIINLASGHVTLYRQAEPIFQEIQSPSINIKRLFQAMFIEWLHNFSALDNSPLEAELHKLPKNELENLKSLGYVKSP